MLVEGIVGEKCVKVDWREALVLLQQIVRRKDAGGHILNDSYHWESFFRMGW